MQKKAGALGVQLDPGVVCETTDVSYGVGDYINNTGLSIKRPDRYYVPAGQEYTDDVGAIRRRAIIMIISYSRSNVTTGLI